MFRSPSAVCLDALFHCISVLLKLITSDFWDISFEYGCDIWCMTTSSKLSPIKGMWHASIHVTRIFILECNCLQSSGEGSSSSNGGSLGAGRWFSQLSQIYSILNSIHMKIMEWLVLSITLHAPWLDHFVDIVANNFKTKPWRWIWTIYNFRLLKYCGMHHCPTFSGRQLKSCSHNQDSSLPGHSTT